MKKFQIGLLFVLLFAFSGCVKPSYRSLNIQRSVGRGTGDNAVTISLDTIEDIQQAESVRLKTEEVAIGIIAFLEKGNVASLPLYDLKKQLQKIVPDDYEFLIDIALSNTQGLTVTVDVVGENNIKRIKSVCKGVLTACEEYSLRDRPNAERSIEVATTNFNVSSEVVEKFGETLKSEYYKRK